MQVCRCIATMLQLKIGAAAAAAGIGLYSYKVMQARSVLPQGRRRRFTPGSAGECLTPISIHFVAL